MFLSSHDQLYLHEETLQQKEEKRTNNQHKIGPLKLLAFGNKQTNKKKATYIY